MPVRMMHRMQQFSTRSFLHETKLSSAHTPCMIFFTSGPRVLGSSILGGTLLKCIYCKNRDSYAPGFATDTIFAHICKELFLCMCLNILVYSVQRGKPDYCWYERWTVHRSDTNRWRLVARPMSPHSSMLKKVNIILSFFCSCLNPSAASELVARQRRPLPSAIFRHQS